MVIFYPRAILNAEPCVGTGQQWVWRDVGEDGTDKLVWELENCETGREGLTRHRWRESTPELSLRLVWGPGEPRDFDSGTAAENRFLMKLYASRVKDVEACSRRGSMVLSRRGGEGEDVIVAGARILSGHSQDVSRAGLFYSPPLKTGVKSL